LFEQLVAAATILIVPLPLLTQAYMSPVVIALAKPNVLAPMIAATNVMTIPGLLRRNAVTGKENSRKNTPSFPPHLASRQMAEVCSCCQ
jgi:hypothetical protein